jgi:hypothetical protein
MRLLVKVSVIVVALGAMGLGLLALRQQRYEVSNQISRAHNRVVDQERAIWRMQAEVARRTDPRDIRESAERLQIELVPIQPAGSAQQAADGTSTSVTPPADPAAGKAAPSPAKPGTAKPAKKKPAEPKKKPSTKPARKDAAAPARKDATHAH